MTLTEAALTLGLTADTLRQQIHAGALKARKVGPLWTVTPAEVERYRTVSRGTPGKRKRRHAESPKSSA